jgi:TPR repeat protein
MFNIGFSYERGLGVVKDYQQARKWYDKAADAGHAGAMNNLGLLYTRGQGVGRD